MYKFLLRSILLFILLAAIYAGYQYSTWAPLPEKESLPNLRFNSSEQFSNQIQEASGNFISLARKVSAPSMSAAAGYNGKIIWSETVGFSDIVSETPATSETLYRIGGSAKSITAAAVMILVDRGMVDLDAPANTYLPDLLKNAPVFSIRQLLSHTAGVGHHNDFGIMAKWNSICECLQFDSVDEAMGLFKNYPLRFDPGEQYFYSTYGYIALSKIIEEVSGEPFFEFISSSILLPLGIENPIPDHSPQNPAELSIATNYETSERSYRKWQTLNFFTYNRNLSYNWAGGGMNATPANMVIFGNALLNEQQLTAPSLYEDFLASYDAKSGESLSYNNIALGWSILSGYRIKLTEEKSVEVTILRSGGLKNGSGNMLILFPEYNFVVDMAINGASYYPSSETYFEQIVQLVKPFLRKIDETKSVSR